MRREDAPPRVIILGFPSYPVIVPYSIQYAYHREIVLHIRDSKDEPLDAIRYPSVGG